MAHVSLEGYLSSISSLIEVPESDMPSQSEPYYGSDRADQIQELRAMHNHSLASRLSSDSLIEPLSPWSRSAAKRLFDVACVLPGLLLLSPALLVIALAVRLTSPGPILFLQKRMGRHGQTFTILKFRTMPVVADKGRHAVTTTENQQFTPIGLFLRRWKLDELPQLLNVLWGDMSLVGPRPKMQEHALFDLQSRPGITGAATLAFAREAAFLANVPCDQLEVVYRTVVLPAKRQLDVEYMSQATLLSDLKLIFNTILRRWDGSTVEDLLDRSALEASSMRRSVAGLPVSVRASASVRRPIPLSADRPVSAGQFETF
jgi:lipopolysaccharide/colanic/teichoic acid biosynthesis glycosyltransferase